MRPRPLRAFLDAMVDDETAREYIANALYVLMTDQRADKSMPRLGDILRRPQGSDNRTGKEIVDGITEKLKARAKGRRKHDGNGD